jgi:DNA-directed RNA polymerase subunit beta'
MEILGIRQTQQYLVEEVQKVYRDQGVQIHDKHIELIVRQMTRRVGVQEPGDAGFLPGERVDAKVFRDTNRALVESSKRPAEGRPEIMGITKASLATDSWLSAASFQETTRVLTEAAIDRRADSLVGLKENIIIGKLIPAGTGMERYRYFDIDAPDYVPMEYFSSDEADPAAYLAGLQGNFVADDNAVFQDLAAEDEVLETLVTVPEQELAPEPEVVTPEAQMPEVETVSVDEVTSEQEPPETSAL